MINLYIDIETLPTIDENTIASLQVPAPMIEAKPPTSNLKDPAKLAEAIAANAGKAKIEQEEANAKAVAASIEAVAKTALAGAYGRIAIIGFAIGDEVVTSWTATDGEVFENELPVIKPGVEAFDERLLIQSFLDSVDEHIEKSGDRCVRLIGHNCINFDLRFIVHRAVIHGVRIPRWFPIAPKPWSDEVVDTMLAWAGTGGRISLDRLCRVLGVEGKTAGVDGGQFAALWASDPVAAAAYCAQDIEATRRVHKRLAQSLYNVA